MVCTHVQHYITNHLYFELFSAYLDETMSSSIHVINQISNIDSRIIIYMFIWYIMNVKYRFLQNNKYFIISVFLTLSLSYKPLIFRKYFVKIQLTIFRYQVLRCFTIIIGYRWICTIF